MEKWPESFERLRLDYPLKFALASFASVLSSTLAVPFEFLMQHHSQPENIIKKKVAPKPGILEAAFRNFQQHGLTSLRSSLTNSKNFIHGFALSTFDARTQSMQGNSNPPLLYLTGVVIGLYVAMLDLISMKSKIETSTTGSKLVPLKEMFGAVPSASDFPMYTISLATQKALFWSLCLGTFYLVKPNLPKERQNGCFENLMLSGMAIATTHVGYKVMKLLSTSAPKSEYFSVPKGISVAGMLVIYENFKYHLLPPKKSM